VTAEENNMMVVADSNNGNKFHIPSCKVIAVDNGNISNIIVDLEYHETDKYRITGS
jgi:hypothetical protein